MRRCLAAAALLALALGAAPAAAQNVASSEPEVRFCPNRPDLGASGCTTRPGEVHLEVSALDWQRDTAGGMREDRLSVGDMLLRAGIGPRTEVQVGWTPLVRVRTRDAAGAVTTRAGAGDVRLGVRQNLRNPGGEGVSFALEPFVVLPVGRAGIGAGDWSAGVVLPATFDLGPGWEFVVTATAQAAADGDAHGRHFAADAIFGLARDLSDAVTVVGEVQVAHDRDPGGRSTPLVAAASAAWHPRARWQVDLLVTAGLNRAAPDLRVLTGGAIVF